MSQETRDFLDQVACIAQANLNHLQMQAPEEQTPDDLGADALMGAYLELYDQYTGTEPRSSAPSDRAYHAAEACCDMRRQLQQRPQVLWDDDEHGLYTLMLAFMFLFKHLYVVRA